MGGGIPDAAYDLASAAAFPGIPPSMSGDEVERRIRRAVDAVWPIAIAAGRAAAAADIRDRINDVVAKAAAIADVPVGDAADHQFVLGVEFAAQIAEGVRADG